MEFRVPGTRQSINDLGRIFPIERLKPVGL